MKQRRRFHSCLAILSMTCLSLLAAETLPRRVFELKNGPNNPRNSEGSFIKLKDGRIMYAYSHFTGTDEGDFGQANISVRFSSDDGESWSAPTMIVPNEGRMNVMSASLLRIAPDTIALFYLRTNSEQDCRPLMRTSTDEGQSWSAPLEILDDNIGYYILNNDRATQLKNGRIMLPLALHSRPGDSTIGQGKVLSAMSDDGGRTWHTGQERNALDENNNSVTLQEPGVIELKDGSVLMYIRTNRGCQYTCHSTDGGETWSQPEPSSIQGPVSPASMKRLKNGDILMVWNDHEGLPQAWLERSSPTTWAVKAFRRNHKTFHADRTPLTTAISKDEGKTWQFVKNLEGNPNGWFCYIAILVEDDHVLLGYIRECNNYNDRFTKVPLSWLYDPTPRPPYQLTGSMVLNNTAEGEFTSLDIDDAKWEVRSGKGTVITEKDSKGLRMMDDNGNSCMELSFAKPLQLSDIHLAVERFSRNEPFYFVIEIWKDGDWSIASALDNDTDTGQQHPIAFADEKLSTDKLRFRCTAKAGAILYYAQTDINLHGFFND